MIIYFTGTGNSRYIAKNIARILDDDIVCINDLMKENKKGDFKTEKEYVIVTPDYMSRMPIPVEKYLYECHFQAGKDVYFVLNGGAAAGKADKYTKKLADAHGLNYKGTTAIRMPANYVVMYDVTPKQEARAAAEKALPVIEKVARDIQEGKPLSIGADMSGHKSFSAIAPLFNATTVSAKKFMVNNDCIGCGTCERLCPLNNIRITNGKPVWGKNCMNCMACISACPKKAINYGNKTVNRQRYYLPDQK
jgi:ferredoxin/flavodoxin